MVLEESIFEKKGEIAGKKLVSVVVGRCGVEMKGKVGRGGRQAAALFHKKTVK
ncbi:hypothetical protein [Kaistella daneshvariae]|uniref:hypothetical protein n=1 Tax=Kaistella daneshvariae TaxID=2487074 RepID=UPI00161DD916|nr:hypothetical protein [Kaistella daneshvariae]